MTADLIRTLASISPTDDQALEDRALACFVVACGELASMRSTGHRDAVVEQLTIVARKLVKANAATSIPKPVRNQSQGLAEGLMRGLVRGGAQGAPKGPALQPAQRAALEITVDPPEIPAWNRQDEAAQEEKAQGGLAQEDSAQGKIALAEIAQDNTIQDNTIQENTIQDNMIQDNTVQEKAVQEEALQDKTVQNKTVQDETREDQATREEKIEVEAAETGTETHAALSWAELEALIKQEAAAIASNH